MHATATPQQNIPHWCPPWRPSQRQISSRSCGGCGVSPPSCPNSAAGAQVLLGRVRRRMCHPLAVLSPLPPRPRTSRMAWLSPSSSREDLLMRSSVLGARPFASRSRRSCSNSHSRRRCSRSWSRRARSCSRWSRSAWGEEGGWEGGGVLRCGSVDWGGVVQATHNASLLFHTDARLFDLLHLLALRVCLLLPSLECLHSKDHGDGAMRSCRTVTSKVGHQMSNNPSSPVRHAGPL